MTWLLDMVHQSLDAGDVSGCSRYLADLEERIAADASLLTSDMLSRLVEFHEQLWHLKRLGTRFPH